jgi:hypothetical protein
LAQAVQAVHDAATFAAVPAGAALPQLIQMPPEMPKRINLRVYIFNMRINEFGYPCAIPLGMILESQQFSNFIRLQVVSPAMHDELQPLQIVPSIQSVVPLRSFRLGKKPFLFIIPDRHNFASGFFR